MRSKLYANVIKYKLLVNKEMPQGQQGRWWRILLYHYNKVVEVCVPQHKPLTPGTKPKPKWINEQVLSKIKTEEQAWINYRHKQN